MRTSPGLKHGEDHGFKELGLLVLAQVVLGSGGTLVRVATSGIDSFVVGCVRFGLVALMLSALFPTRFPPHVEKRLFVVGLCFVQQYICWYAAIARLPLGVASLLNGTSPVFCVLFETFLLKQAPPRAFGWIAAATGLGVALLYQNPFTDASVHLDGVGIVYGMCAGMGIAGTMLAMRALRLSEFGALELMGRSNIYTALVLGCIGFAHAKSWPPLTQWQPYAAAVALSVLCQGVGCCLQLVVLRGVRASIVGISTLMGPLFASIYGEIFFDETITARMVVGGVFILGATVAALTMPKAANAVS